MSAEIPFTGAALAAPWTALASDSGFGTGPDPAAATAIAVPAPIGDHEADDHGQQPAG